MSQIFVQVRIRTINFSDQKASGYHEDDDVVAAAEPPVVVAAEPPVFAAPRPFSADPVAELLVSLLLRPVGCKRFMGMLGNFPMNLPATIGPTINAKKMMNMKK